MSVKIEAFTMQHYESAISLWKTTPGMGLSEADEPDAIRRYLARNPETSFVAVDEDGTVAGTVLCGHDGRRGYLYHLAVRTTHRGQGIGESLVNAAMDGLRRERIDKCHIMVLMDNAVGQGFWEKIGWLKRDFLYLYSSNVNPCDAAANDSCPC